MSNCSYARYPGDDIVPPLLIRHLPTGLIQPWTGDDHTFSHGFLLRPSVESYNSGQVRGIALR